MATLAVFHCCKYLSGSMSWSANQYLKFEAERNRPIRDLLAHIPHRRVVHAADLGCGPGNSTELLRDRFSDADIVGIDSSTEMIAAAKNRLPGVRFEVQDIAVWDGADASFDVILANAVLQWVPDHTKLLPSLLAKLAPGGSLAVQIPDNSDEPAHQLMRDLSTDPVWAERLSGAEQASANRHNAEWYFRALRGNVAAVDVWRTTYYHPLAGTAALVEWFKGTGLRPFLRPLNQNEQAAFLRRYEAALAQAYPPLPDGNVVLPFPRLFFVASR